MLDARHIINLRYRNFWIPAGILLSVDLIEHRGKPSRTWEALLQSWNMGKIGEGRRRTLFIHGIRQAVEVGPS